MHRLVNAVMGELLVGTTPMSGVVVSQQAFSYHHLMCCCCVSTVLLIASLLLLFYNTSYAEAIHSHKYVSIFRSDDPCVV